MQGVNGGINSIKRYYIYKNFFYLCNHEKRGPFPHDASGEDDEESEHISHDQHHLLETLDPDHGGHGARIHLWWVDL